MIIAVSWPTGTYWRIFRSYSAPLRAAVITHDALSRRYPLISLTVPGGAARTRVRVARSTVGRACATVVSAGTVGAPWPTAQNARATSSTAHSAVPAASHRRRGARLAGGHGGWPVGVGGWVLTATIVANRRDGPGGATTGEQCGMGPPTAAQGAVARRGTQ